MKDDKEIEKILLNDEEYENFVNKRTEQDFEKELEDSCSNEVVVEDFKSVINKTSKTKSYINGVQAEGFLGSQNIVRANFLDKKINSFVAGDMYIKFYKYKV